MSKRKFRKSGKGLILRPCHFCGESVNFIPWVEESEVRGKKIWHWANEDGTHHVHVESREVEHLRDILLHG